nr:MAG TPA: DNA POLYMERASE [Caudoviricetes sp.]
MNVLTVDFETYYDREYSLSKMTMIEYIMDGRFQPIMMSYSINDEPIKNVIGYPKIKEVLDGIDWDNTVLNAQNTAFDATIIRARFGHTARYYTDTMAMARVTAAHVFEGASLGAIAKVLQANGVPVPPKGKEVQSALGMHLYNAYQGTPYLALKATTDPNEVQRGHELLMGYVEYCNNDVHLAREAFKYFTKMITPDEMQYGDMILKCYIEPSLYLDLPIIEEEIQRIHERDEKRARDVANKYFNGKQAELRSVCRSVPKFTEFLRGLGGILEHEIDEDADYAFVIPSKYSEKKGRVEPCYSKTFPAVIEMCDRMDEIGDIFRTKLAMSSSIELSRAERFRAIAKIGCGFGMPYTVSGAHTHRLGGCVVADTKVIVLTAETCIMEKNITDVLLSDLVWDGEEFCEHEGVAFRGYQEVITHDGITGTRDHPCFINENETVGLAELAEQGAGIMDCPTPKDWGINLDWCGESEP